MSKNTAIKIEPGMVFLVPVKGSDPAVGVVARFVDPAVLGYFFEPKTANHTGPEVWKLRAKDAIWIVRHGPLAIESGEWPIVGAIQDWDLSEWPIPPLVLWHKYFDRYFLKHYDEELRLIREEPVSERRIRSSKAEDGSAGAGYVSTRLERILQNGLEF